MFLLKRTDQDRGYVAPAGSDKAYTKNIFSARVFPTREEAERHRCVENEIIVDAGTLWEYPPE